MRRRQIQFDKKDEPFRSDVRELGDAQAGTEVATLLRDDVDVALPYRVDHGREVALLHPS